MTENIIDFEKHDQFRQRHTRPVQIASNEFRDITMPPNLWKELEFVTVVEGVSMVQLAQWAAEEVELHDDISFDQAFRGVVTYITNLWTP